MDENLIAQLARRRVVTETFRRLAPQKKDQVYRVALQLVGRYGYDGLPVERFCREAGISKGSFFQYFPSKSHLLEFVVLAFDKTISEWVTHLRTHETKALARDRLAYLYREVVLNARLHPAERLFFLYVARASRHSAVEITGVNPERHLHQYVREIITRGEEAGEIRGDLSPEIVTQFVAGLFGGIIEQAYAGGTAVTPPAAEEVVGMLLDGLKA